jgi:hypothetical protein
MRAPLGLVTYIEHLHIAKASKTSRKLTAFGLKQTLQNRWAKRGV